MSGPGPEDDPILAAVNRGGVWTTEPDAPVRLSATEFLQLADVIKPRPCPLCDKEHLGFPRHKMDGTWTAEHWAAGLRWVARRDLHSAYEPIYVCPVCDGALGIDYVALGHEERSRAAAREAVALAGHLIRLRLL